jgi:hypothetical protein
MAKFKGKEDAGFKAVSEQLRLWMSEIEENNVQNQAANPTSKPNITDARAARVKRFETMKGVTLKEGSVF